MLCIFHDFYLKKGPHQQHLLLAFFVQSQIKINVKCLKKNILTKRRERKLGKVQKK